MIRFFRDADWLTPRRARAYALLLAAVPAAAGALWIALAVAHGGLDSRGRPVAPDFAAFYAAGSLAGDPAAAYDPARHFAQQRALFGSGLVAPTPFVYPPTFLALCAGLAAVPYALAASLWIGLSLALYAGTMRAIWPGRGTWLPILAFPGALLNALNGQTGLFAAALMGTAALCLDRRPGSAGACLAALCCKPQLVLLAPVALVRWGRWRALVAAAIVLLGLLGASVAVLGRGAWPAFLVAGGVARRLLESGAAGPARMVTPFAAAQLWGAPTLLAYAIHAAVAAVVLILVLRRRVTAGLAQGAVLAAAAPLLSPYLFDYDLAILALPLAWLMREVESSGAFLPWEKLAAASAFALPLLARPCATYLFLPLSPFLTLLLLIIIQRRARMGDDLEAGRRGRLGAHRV